MKSLIILVLLLNTQIFTQIDKFEVIDNEYSHPKGISQQVNPIEHIDSLDIQNNESRRSVKKTVLDNGFLLVEEVSQRFNGSNLVNDSRETYMYDGNNNKQEYYYEKWIDNKWVFDLKASSTYNENNNLVWQGFWKYNSGPLVEYPWYDYLNDTYKYDQNNNVVEWVRQKSENSEWMNLFKYVYKYDGNNNIVEKVWFKWSESEWINHQRESYIYDENNNERQQLIQNWDGSKWVHDSVKESKYNENNLIECLYMKHADIWINNKKETYTYDPNNDVIEFLRQKWQNNNWVNDLKREYTYTYYSEANYTEIMYLLFPRDSGWVYNQRINYQYSANSLFELLVAYPVYSEGELFWKLDARHLYSNDINQNLLEDKYQEWDDSESEWQTLELNSYTYMPMTGLELDIDQISVYELSNNYPNPFNPSTKINYSIPEESLVSLKIFDVLGREVVTLVNKEQSQGNYEVEFDGSNLTSGIYFCRIQASDFIEIKKMVLIK